MSIIALARSRVATSVHDAGWGSLLRLIGEKAAAHGRTVVRIDQWELTSQVCPVCETRGGPKPLHMRVWTCPSCGAVLDRDYNAAANIFCLTPNVTHARSRGTVRLRSRDFRDKPCVDPRYFTDPEGYDMRIMTAGIRKAREIVAQSAQSALSEWAGEELFPGADVQTDEEIADYIRRTHNTVYHPAGSCRMGPADDVMSPLDPQLRVKGVQGLRVADASVMPELTTVNPNITVYMIGERAAELIAAER